LVFVGHSQINVKQLNSFKTLFKDDSDTSKLAEPNQQISKTAYYVCSTSAKYYCAVSDVNKPLTVVSSTSKRIQNHDRNLMKVFLTISNNDKS